LTNVRQEKLPAWIDAKWFRQTFVSTYMAFVGQLMDPWDVPAMLAVEKMQVIWDVTAIQDYEITTSTHVYRKVCDGFVLDHKTNTYIQAVQRLSDSWRNVIGSNGIAIILAFFASQDDYRDSDTARQEFASELLVDLRFAYWDADHDDKDVSLSSITLYTCLIVTSQKWKGLFRNPFILQTFASHFSAIEGAENILGIHNVKTAAAYGALGLCIASVSTSFVLLLGCANLELGRASAEACCNWHANHG
jgi:hypothetical protein